jgi:isoquinoline 1-oxidoreductase beta subunit
MEMTMHKPTDISTEILSAAAGQRISRRGFLSFAVNGLALAFVMPIVGRIGNLEAATTPTDLANAYIHIGTDGTITLAFGGAEMGQGSMSGLPQILAEELMVDWEQILVQQWLFDPLVSYLTGGSSAVSGRFTTLLKAGAAARELLIAAAMLKTGDPTRSRYRAESAQVFYSGGPSPSASWVYADLAVGAASAAAKSLLPAGDPPLLADPLNYRLIGQPVQRVDIPAKVDGSAKYGIDVWFPDMKFAAIKHCPIIGGKLLAANIPPKPAAALALVPCTASDTRGKVVAGTTNAVAVVATNSWLAFKLANSLSVKWTLPTATSDVDSNGILSLANSLMATGSAILAEPAPPATSPPTPPYAAGPYETSVGLDLGTTPTVVAKYTLPYLAHATMEVPNCTVKITFSGSTPTFCEIWAPTQAAGWVVNSATTLTKLPSSAIVVHTTFLGGGLGRKIEQDYIWQAIQVALAVKAPVKVTWRREEDLQHDQYRPFALANVAATLSGGKIKAWSYRTVSQSILGQRGWLGPGFVDSQAVEGAVHLAYDLGNHLVEWVPLTAGIPVGFWRSVGSSINAFAVESTMDELAKAAGKDPFKFRYDHLTSSAAQRMYSVLGAADLMSSSWRKALPAGRAWGVAIAESFGTVVCEVVEISQPAAGSLRVHRVDCVVDCGTVINPDSVEAQMQGGILHALNATLWGESTFTAGKANQSNFNRYRVMRLSEMPVVKVQILDSTRPPSGVGEPAVPPLAPALANAYARLTGNRVYKLPFFPGATMGGL